MKRREVKETVKKEFLLQLLAPFLPPLMKDEKITDISIETNLTMLEITYIIIREGGVNNS